MLGQALRAGRPGSPSARTPSSADRRARENARRRTRGRPAGSCSGSSPPSWVQGFFGPMKCTTCASAIASKSRDAQVYCQFQTGEISAQPPCSTALIRSWSSPIRSGGCCLPEGEAALQHLLALNAATSISSTPLLKTGLPARPRRLKDGTTGPACATACCRAPPPADAARCRRRAAPRSRRPARRRRRRGRGCAGTPRRTPPAAPAADRPPRSAGGPVRRPRRRRAVATRQTPHAQCAAPDRDRRPARRCRCRSPARASSAAIWLGREGGEAQVAPVGGEDHRPVGRGPASLPRGRWPWHLRRRGRRFVTMRRAVVEREAVLLRALGPGRRPLRSVARHEQRLRRQGHRARRFRPQGDRDRRDRDARA